jgi:hypothetical protein
MYIWMSTAATEPHEVLCSSSSSACDCHKLQRHKPAHTRSRLARWQPRRHAISMPLSVGRWHDFRHSSRGLMGRPNGVDKVHALRQEAHQMRRNASTSEPSGAMPAHCSLCGPTHQYLDAATCKICSLLFGCPVRARRRCMCAAHAARRTVRCTALLDRDRGKPMSTMPMPRR